jgi:hypothetical protein
MREVKENARGAAVIDAVLKLLLDRIGTAD